MAGVSSLIEEILIAAALTLITVALWSRVGRLALVVPGLVILWLALPSREPFVSSPPPTPEKAVRKKE